nr:coxsackievirus and adenovirus receptor homolog [Nerophis lumbriciformis]XP_061784781.1 coxsackievirus and adenovirus receptor homolog [Nerophis lumbriciformis]
MMMSVLWYFAAWLAFCTKNPAWAFEIIATELNYYAVQESNVKLPCKFTHDIDDISNKIIIRWYFKSPEEKQEILMYHGGQLDIDPNYSRVHFTSPEPGHGDASIEISDLRMSDEGIYQCSLECELKGLPGYTLNNFMLRNLKVMEKMSAPVCAIEGDPVLGNDVTLQCESSQGTPPLNYSWKKMSEKQMLAPNASGDAIGGNLTVKKISEDNCGSYRCTVENLVETQLCEILLPCPKAPVAVRRNKIKVITAVATAILLVVIVVSFWGLRRISREQVTN